MAKKNNNDILSAITAIGQERQISPEVVTEALEEAMVKAYIKDAGIEELDVKAEINTKTNDIDLYQNYRVVEKEDEDFDDEVQMTLDEARKIDPSAEVGGTVSRLIHIEDKTALSRAAAMLAKSVLKQKIREAEKKAVYDEYADRLTEMVNGTVESVKSRFALVNIGRTVAVMPRYMQIPTETIHEGQPIDVVITEVNEESKGPQVLVSRADPMLVKRLFEREVPEIYQGIVEIKAIAREAGERTKMAVYSHDPDVDAIGACVGPQASRVMGVSRQICNEKIDIFKWSDDLTELVRNALAPAEIEAVLPGNEPRSLLVVVSPDQLSLAIGKHGKNARLAVKLTNYKIDIKTREELEDEGYNYDDLMAKADEMKETYRKKSEEKEAQRRQEEYAQAEEKRQEAIARFTAKNGEISSEEGEDIIPEEMQEVVSDKVLNDMAMETEKPSGETKDEAAVEQAEKVSEPEEEPEEPVSTAEESKESEAEEEKPETEKKPEPKKKNTTMKQQSRSDSHKHADLEKMAAQNTYVSVFEKLADTSRPKQESKPRRRKRKGEEDNYKVSNKELAKQLKGKISQEAAKPVYTDEELAEIEAQQEAEEESEYDIDYDEYEDYYDDEDKN